MRKKKKLFLSGYGVVVICCFLLVSSFYSSLSDRLYEERRTHLLEITEKTAGIVDTLIESRWDMLENSVNMLERVKPATNLQLQEQLDNVQKDLDMDGLAVMAFDNKGNCYESDGTVRPWKNPSDIKEGRDRYLFITTKCIGNEKNEKMIFIKCLENPILLENGLITISHLAFSIKLRKFYDALNVSTFENNCYTYIINCDGTQVYNQEISKELVMGCNVVQELAKKKFYHGGSGEELLKAVEKGQGICMEFEGKKDSCFVGIQPIANQKDWMLVQFVPTSVIGSGTHDYMNYVVVYASLIAFMVIIVVVVAIYIIIVSGNSKRLVKQKEEANRLLNKAALEAQAANVAKSEFLSNMSHDIRTPINGIMGMTDIALRHFEDKERVRECLNKISGSSEHLLSLINDVLDMSRIESGKIVIAENSIDLIRVVDNCVSILDGQIRKKKVKLRKEYTNIIHRLVIGDQLHISQILVNILGNAVKFTPKDGTVDVRVKEIGSDGETATFRLEIEDNGIGMREEFLPKIFEPFAQEDRDSRTEYRGTGLGMAITKKFVDLMNGKISVVSRHGEGTLFTVELTLRIDTAEQVKLEANQEEISLNGLKVLLVEDNELNMEIALCMLEDEGIQVTTAINGEDALECFKRSKLNEYDAILMDIMMPVMNGLEATKAIRALERPDAQHVPIIAMTANAFSEDIIRTKEAGMNEHLAKPMKLDVLLKILQQYKSNPA